MQDTFNGGYTKALLDVRNYIERHSEVLKYERMFNYKNILKLMDALIDHREEMRTTGTANLKWNPERKEFVK